MLILLLELAKLPLSRNIKNDVIMYLRASIRALAASNAAAEEEISTQGV
jgi:hypothetical protein